MLGNNELGSSRLDTSMDNKIIKLLETAVEKRKVLRSCNNAIRLVNGLGDGLGGLVIEQYNNYFVAQVFDKRWLKEKEELIKFLKSHFDCRYLVVKDRSESIDSRPDAFKTIVWIENKTSKTIIEENNLKFSVDLNDTLNSGLFLDMRQNRKIVAELANKRKVLNCFAYTCSFGVYCRAYDALSVVNVDISKKALERARENYKLNQIVPARNEFICQDVEKYLRIAVKKDNRFDLIIIDPPSFARYERKNFNVKKDLPILVDLAVKALNPNGFLFIATNFSGISCNNLKGIIKGVLNGRQIKRVQYFGQDKDFVGSGFRSESYLAAVLAEV